MDKLKMQTRNKVDENIQKIGALFPNCVTERKNENGEVEAAIDFDALRQELSEAIVEGPEERYQFTWPDKKKSILLANAPIHKTLRPCREESVDFDKTENLYIEGDNLEVLKLLQETYLGKIKLIYIDPPYNTGNDFVYCDKFQINADEWNEISGSFDEFGNQVIGTFEKNLESKGRFHTDWLNMMYPRLKLARDLLSEDGVIFISMDDNEHYNLLKICNEVFSADNFLAIFPRVTKRGGKSTNLFAKNNDYIIAYSRNIKCVDIVGTAHFDEEYKYQDEYIKERGPYKLNQTLDYNTLQYTKSMDYPIDLNGHTYYPGGDIELHKRRQSGIHGKHDWVWRWSKPRFDFGNENGWIEVSKTGRIYTKTYLNAFIEKDSKGNYVIKYGKRTKPVTTLEFTENIYSNDNSNKEITGIMGATLFDYVKPTSAINKILQIVSNNADSIILDFFSGSATTAHAVMQLNAEDGGNRKFIMVQLPEATTEKSEAFKAGYRNICEIGKERIRRAGRKIKEENGLTASNLDTGFRVLKLDSSNMRDVYYRPDEYMGEIFDALTDNVKSDRTAEDLLFQVMLDLGVMLSSRIEEFEVTGKKVFDVADGFLMACFDENVTDETILAIAKRKPYYFVMRDSSMANDSVATNFDQIFAAYSPETVRKVI